MTAHGYAGSVLRVDLSTGKIEQEPLDMGLARRFVGGAGMNCALFEGLQRPGSDPFAPENPIVLGAGPLVGTRVPGTGKVEGTTKFALSATEDGRCYVASASSGSRRFGVMLKRAGDDHLVITGRAPKPVVVQIMDDQVEIADADRLWGRMDAYETAEELERRVSGCGVITIGASGENRVKFALALTDKMSTLGRNGFGAVMGSKGLKAICVRGTGRVGAKDPDRLKAALAPLLEHLGNNPMMPLYHELGVHLGWELYKSSLNPGLWPVDKWDRLYGVDKCRQAVERTRGCTGCVIRCKPIQRVSDGPWKGAHTETNHFLHAAILAQMLGIEDWRTTVRLLEVCNRAGICALSSVGLMAMATECREKGTLSEGQAGGVRLSRDDPAGYLPLLEKTIRREGLGAVLAEGWLEAAKALGADPHEFIGLVKGAPCIFDARDTNLNLRIVHQVVNPRGGHHPQGHWIASMPLQPLEKLRDEFAKTGAGPEVAARIFGEDDFNSARLTRHIEDVSTIFDSLGTCLTYPMTGAPLNMITLAEFYSAVTGLETGAAELKAAGERSFNLLKQLNVKEGFSRKEDVPPRLWFRPKPTPEGDKEFMDYYGRRRIDEQAFEKILDDYYDERGWNVDTGTPTADKLEELGLA